MMTDFRTAKILGHQRNIKRYARLLATELTELERQYLHKRIAEQVQKYEKGMNRIGAGRLRQISHFLQVPVAFFFEGVVDSTSVSETDVRWLADMNDFVSSSEGLRLVAAFTRIENGLLQRRIVDLVQEIADYQA